MENSENYAGKICPYCKTEIKEDEQVIACPSCAIPHHTSCWEENRGCTTFGCSEQFYEERGVNPTDVCSGCGAPMGDGQAFCSKCGTAKAVAEKICPSCKAQLLAEQEFCPRCGAKYSVTIESPVSEAINQFNSTIVNQKKKKKKLPIILAVIMLIVSVGGFVGFSIVQQQKLEQAITEYKADVKSFYTKVLSSGTEMEKIGNSIQESWRKYISSSYGTYYYGEYVYSVDSAVEAAQSHMSSNILAVKAANPGIESLYSKLLVIPDSDNRELIEIKAAVRDVYDAYNDMYDCVITPSGNYNTWTSEFADVDSELADSIGDLSDLV